MTGQSEVIIVNRVLFLVGLAAGLLGGAHQTSAEIKERTKITHYQLNGKSDLDMVRQMHRKGRKTGEGVILASTLIKPNYALRFSGPDCAGGSLFVDVRFGIKLPKPRRQLDGKTAKNFNIFYQFLERHEQQHKAIALQCFTRAQKRSKAVLGAVKSCSQIKQVQERIKTILAAEGEACQARHAALDRRDTPKVSRFALYKSASAQARHGTARQAFESLVTLEFRQENDFNAR